ncbi:MAG: hypothetical protein ABR530_08670 [Pyrinomonadaceae bacterium]
MKAQDLLKKGETAMVIFTDGNNFEINEGGLGRTGHWRIRENAGADKVIIYFRNKVKKENEIFIAEFVRLHHSRDAGFERRFAVEFKNARSLGTTDSNWIEFMGARRGAVSPVKYIK